MLIFIYECSVDEESAGRARAEKEKKVLETQNGELQEDIDSEKEGRLKAEKAKRHLEDELESLRQSLDESEGATAAQQVCIHMNCDFRGDLCFENVYG